MRWIGALAIATLLAGCTQVHIASHLFKKANPGAGPACKFNQEGAPKIGNPYKSHGVRYVPVSSSTGFREKGVASWYGSDFHGRTTANGECYNMYKLTAAHPTLPMPTIVRVKNLENGKEVTVRINDRGPFARGRVIDLSYAAAKEIGMVNQGTAPVQVVAIGGHFHEEAPTRATRVAQRKLNPATTIPAPEALEMESGGSFTNRISRQNNSAMQVNMPTAQAESLSPPPDRSTVPYSSPVPLAQTEIYVQTGAFGSVNNAKNQLHLLRRVANNSFMAETNTDGRRLHRVRVGPFASIAEADAALFKLVNAGFNAAQLIVEEGKSF